MDFPQEHLGDGVYAIWDGWQVWLDCRAQIGLSEGPTGIKGIALEPTILESLNEFVKRQITNQQREK